MKIDDLFQAPFVEGGRDAKGYDCFGLFQELCRRRNAPVPEQLTPSFPPEGEGRAAEMLTRAEQCGWKPITTPVPGCAVAIRFGPWVSHLGMVLDDGMSFIHTNEKAGVTVTKLDDPRWKQRIAGFYQHG